MRHPFAGRRPPLLPEVETGAGPMLAEQSTDSRCGRTRSGSEDFIFEAVADCEKAAELIVDLFAIFDKPKSGSWGLR